MKEPFVSFDFISLTEQEERESFASFKVIIEVDRGEESTSSLDNNNNNNKSEEEEEEAVEGSSLLNTQPSRLSIHLDKSKIVFEITVEFNISNVNF